MSDDTSSSWSRGLKRWLASAPETRDELLKLIQDSHKFLQADMVDMLEGVLELPATQVREIMTPRTQMASLTSDDTLAEILAVVNETEHSRYPVFDSTDENAVIGILLTKDLIPVLTNQLSSSSEPHDTKPTPPKLLELIRKPLYTQESSRCDTLLRSLQRSQVHMAIVIDDFGGVSGVVTMEDLLEEIVGDIVDEHDDFDEDSDVNNIMPHPNKPDVWVIYASTLISDCNEKLGTAFDDTDVDTMGGLVMHALGAVSTLQGEVVQIDGYRLEIVEADGRHISEIELTPLSVE